MKRQNRHIVYEQLRKEFPVFTFSNYSYHIDNNGLKAVFLFDLSGKHKFTPTFFIKSGGNIDFKKTDHRSISSFVFHIGMVELVSYWKAACPQKVLIKTNSLSGEQILWWKKLYFNGLGEFFYLNGIQPDFENFMEIETVGEEPVKDYSLLDEQKVLVPVGGGKDSAVTLELLKRDKNIKIIPFMLNPRDASVRTVENAGLSLEDAITVERTIDKKLLQLNDKGFLNGHTPFSALLAFVSSFAATVAQAKHIALSNESSANQSTVPGTKINHQYSKSFEFETAFRLYTKKYLQNEVNYFSFLRPLNELQIAKLFSKFTSHHLSFRSCNVGSKTDSWCAKCPKCLFTAIILSPFIEKEKTVTIFGKDILNDISLKPVFDELTGTSRVKPFECVGTPSEVNAALAMAFSKTVNKPALLENYNGINNARFINDFDMLLKTLNKENYVPGNFMHLITDALYG